MLLGIFKKLFICELIGSPIWRTGRFPPFCSPDFLRRLEGKAVHGAALPQLFWRLETPDSSKKDFARDEKDTFSTFQLEKLSIFGGVETKGSVAFPRAALSTLARLGKCRQEALHSTPANPPTDYIHHTSKNTKIFKETKIQDEKLQIQNT